MKYVFTILSVFFILSCVVPLNAQPKYIIQMEDTLNLSSENQANGIAVDKDKNVYITGYFYNSNSNDDYLTAKYDSSGNLIWNVIIDNGDEDQAKGIAVDTGGNVYITGISYINSSDNCFTVKYDSSGIMTWADSVSNGNGSDITLDKNDEAYVSGGLNNTYMAIKYNALGSMAWLDTLNNGNSAYSYGIAVDNNGNVYVTGTFDNGSNYDYLTVKYDSSGDLIWADTTDNGNPDFAMGIAVDGNYNIYVTGYSKIDSNYDFLTVKYDSACNVLWEDTLDYGSDAMASGIAVDNNGNVYVTGRWNNDYLTVKYDSLGNLVWVDTLSISAFDYSRGIALDNEGNIYVAGASYIGNPSYDCIIIKYAKYKDIGISTIASPDTVYTDSSYTPGIWVKNLSYEDTFDFDVASYIDSEGTTIYADTLSVNNLAAGDSVLVNFAGWTLPPDSMVLTLKFAILSTLIPDMDTTDDTISTPLYVIQPTGIASLKAGSQTRFSVYPLAEGKIFYSYDMEKPNRYTITLYDLSGKVLKQRNGNGVGHNTGIIENIPSGIYFLKFKQGKQEINRKVTLVK